MSQPSAESSPRSTTTLARRQRFLGERTPLFYQQPVHIVRGEGVWLFDVDGKRYLDMYNNVPCVGHGNPRVVKAVSEQMATLNVHSRYLHDSIIDYSERLLGLHHHGLTQAVFACSGTEANEIALQMARIATGGRGIICTNAAYHGNSEAVGKLTHAGRRPDPEIRSITFPDTYRPLIEGATEEELCRASLDELRKAIDDFAANGVTLAGLLICPLFANEGLPDVPAGFMQQAAQMVHDAGGLVISDEVQAGFCRSGHWWGYEHANITPDIVSMGKPMGNGVPFSGVAASEALTSAFRKRGYFNTFASSPMQAAAGMAVLDEIESRQLLDQVNQVGGYLRAELDSLQKRHEIIGKVRGCGLFAGIDLVKNRDSREPDQPRAAALANALKDKGFLTGNAGAHGNVLKIRPPLVYEREHAEMFLEVLDDTLAQVAAMTL